MSRFTDYIERKKQKYSDEFDASNLVEKFIPYFNSQERIKIRRHGEVTSGRVGVTTGWKPAFLLMFTSRSLGSSYILDENDEIVSQEIEKQEPLDIPPLKLKARKIEAVKYKVGDRIKIRKDLDKTPIVPSRIEIPIVILNSCMLEFAGEEAMITIAPGDGSYMLNIDGQRSWWNDDMFEEIKEPLDIPPLKFKANRKLMIVDKLNDYWK